MSDRGEGAAAAVAPPRRTGRPGSLVLLALAVVVQLVVLYAPAGGGPALFSQSDKVVHVLVFLVPVALAVVAGFPIRVVAGVFAAQAVVSELVQGAFLAHRSGDPLDVVADLAGVALGVLVGTTAMRVLKSRAAARGRP